MVKKIIIISFIVLFLFSCASQKLYHNSRPSEPQNNLLTSPIPLNIPARNFIYKGQEKPGYGAYGYVLFPIKGDYERQIITANAFLSTFQDVSDFDEYVDSKNLMVTNWPLIEHIKDINPNLLIDKYDYAFSTLILISIDKLNSIGPVLAAFDNFNIYQAQHRLMLDMSKFSNEEIQSALLLWKNKICLDPIYWKNGFDLARIKIELRSFLNKYGDSILSIFSA